MRTTLALLALLGCALAVSGSAIAAPGNGTNTVYVFNDCDSGVGQVALVSQASAAGRFATAHLVASNRPAPRQASDDGLAVDHRAAIDQVKRV